MELAKAIALIGLAIDVYLILLMLVLLAELMNVKRVLLAVLRSRRRRD